MVGENRADVRQAVVELRRTLTNMTDATARLDKTLEVNSENIDELLDNMRHVRSEEHTSELQSRLHLVCRLLLEKKKKPLNPNTIRYSAAASWFFLICSSGLKQVTVAQASSGRTLCFMSPWQPKIASRGRSDK